MVAKERRERIKVPECFSTDPLREASFAAIPPFLRRRALCSFAVSFSTCLVMAESVASRRMLENILKAFRFLLTGQFRRVWNEVHVRLYRTLWAGCWWALMPGRRAGRPKPSGTFSLETKHPV